MKTLFIIPALLLGAPAFAGEILPTLYAREYCSMREMGVSSDQAHAAAASTAYLDNGVTPPQVTIDGETYGVDVVRAARMISDRCPNV